MSDELLELLEWLFATKNTLKLVVVGLLQQQVQLLEVVRQERPASPHEVEDMLEHLPVPTVR